MENLRGVVERITYANEETGYSVIKIKCKGYMDLVTVVGSMATVNVGAVITMRGFWTSNPKYGDSLRQKNGKKHCQLASMG